MTDPRIDGTKIMFHPHRVAQWQASHVADDWDLAKKLYPLYVEISPVGACNHRCTFCAVDYIGYKNVQIEGRILRDRLREMGELGVKSVMFAGEGEPLLHKETNANVVATTVAGIDVAFTTNGVLLDKLETLDLCTWLKVSVNAGTRDTYMKIHKAHERDWDRVWLNIAQAAKRKGACTLGVQMVALPENEHEWPDLYNRASDAGADYVVLKPYSQHKSSITTEYDGFRAKKLPAADVLDYATKLYVRDDAPSHEAQSYTKCHATPNFWAYIMASGAVYSCSAYLLDKRFELGNIVHNSFQEIWNSDRRRENWEFVRKDLDISECRLNCRMHKSNEYLDALAKGVPHQSFV